MTARGIRNRNPLTEATLVLPPIQIRVLAPEPHK